MPVGRKPLPTAIRKARGNPGHKKLNSREPTPSLVLPEPPEGLTDREQKVWRRLSKELFEAGVLTNLDQSALRIMTQLEARLEEANEVLQNSKLIILTKSGNLIQNPMLGVANRTIDQLMKLYTEFGMTPSSRTRINVVEPEEGKDSFEAFLNARVVGEESDLG